MVYSVISLILTFVTLIYLIYILVFTSSSIAEIITSIGAFLGFAGNTLTSLYHSNLTFFLFSQKIKSKFVNYSTRWGLDIRYSGNFERDIISNLLNNFRTTKNYSIAIINKTSESLLFNYDNSLLFRLEFISKNLNDDLSNSIDVSITPFEIGIHSSKQKLHKQILPFLTYLETLVHPEYSSYSLNVDFINGNPFFTLFMANLNPAYIKTFNVNLNINNDKKESDSVKINKESITLISSKISYLEELAEDFLYLSSNIKNYIRAFNA
jgi:hypothetical protein